MLTPNRPLSRNERATGPLVLVLSRALLMVAAAENLRRSGFLLVQSVERRFDPVGGP